MKKIAFVIFFVLLSQVTICQTTINGVVIDGLTSTPIVDVNIQLSSSNLGTTTNDKGEFEIKVNDVSGSLIFTHINYNVYVEEIGESSKGLIIKLNPKSNIINEISIVSNTIPDTLTNHEEYSVTSFELMNDNLYWIEFHGTFKKKRLTVKNMTSDQETSILLDTIKNVRALQKSCSRTMYLLTHKFAYPIIVSNLKVNFGDRIKLSFYEKYIQPCVARSVNNLIYFKSEFNGLQTSYLRYNIMDESLTELAKISEDTLVRQYKSDIGLINRSQVISNIKTNSVSENERIRNLQEDGDFLSKVYYRPDLKNFIFYKYDQLFILNHVKGQIERYEDHLLSDKIEMQYDKIDNWLKHVVLDEVSKELYAIYASSKGIELRRVLLETGKSELVEYLETDLANFDSIKIHNGFAYYLSKDNAMAGFKLILKKQL